MTCPYVKNDAAYVLGALTPEERHQYEEHLRGCRVCSTAVREVAGLPGLLARLPAARMTRPDADTVEPPLPQTLLPRLLRQVGRDRRRSRWRVGVAAASVAAALAVGGTVAVQHLGPAPQRPAATRTVEMQAVGNRPVSGTVQMFAWGWGTTLRVTCHSGYGNNGGGAPGPVFTLWVTDRAGTQYLVTSWHSMPDEDVTVPGGIALAPEDVVTVQVKDDQQMVVMQGW